ncbi:hypothetical protein ILYODFUR_029438 [Ilyodon furcidens]|uniref:Uncharacterized protein n=1 Tax=Ilyodon furcidens TaxID=33524 RepID=A0ABV0UK23_9TELE
MLVLLFHLCQWSEGSSWKLSSENGNVSRFQVLVTNMKSSSQFTIVSSIPGERTETDGLLHTLGPCCQCEDPHPPPLLREDTSTYYFIYPSEQTQNQKLTVRINWKVSTYTWMDG